MQYRTFKTDYLIGPLTSEEEKSAPIELFAAGDISILREKTIVSIVGARVASPEGLRRASRLARLCVRRGLVVMSGLAEGVDTAAHESAIRSGGRTIAVLGTPLDQVYPKKNAELQHRIMREHLVISQYPMGYPVQPKNFPLRNLTMALLSDVTVIIEATDASGSLHQGWEALRLGRLLFITKSTVENTGLTWPEKMIRSGALILSDDSIEEFFDLTRV